MNQSFIHIATFRFVHEFMLPEASDLFSIQVVGDSRTLLSNFQLLVKPFLGGFHLLGSDLSLLEEEQSILMVNLMLKDSYFFNYTDLGGLFRPDLRVFHFSNTNSTVLPEKIILDEYASLKDSLEIFNSSRLSSDFDNSEIEIFDSSESTDITTLFSSQKAFIFFSKTPSGRKGFYVSGSLLEKKPFGIVSLNLGKVYKDYIDKGDVLEFEVKFKTQRSHWKYILSNPIFDKFSNLLVVDLKGNEIQFQAGDFEIQPNRIVRSFESRSPIPLKNANQSRFQLIDQPTEPNQSEKVVIKTLPSASPKQLFMTPSKPDIFFSHIFI